MKNYCEFNGCRTSGMSSGGANQRFRLPESSSRSPTRTQVSRITVLAELVIM